MASTPANRRSDFVAVLSHPLQKTTTLPRLGRLGVHEARPSSVRRVRRGVGLREYGSYGDQRDPAAGTKERGGTGRAAAAAAGGPGQEAGWVVGRGDGCARGARRCDRRCRTAGGNRTEGA